MTNQLKLKRPAMALALCLVLPACQTTSPASSSVMQDAINETASAVCADLKPETLTPGAFDTLPNWMQAWLVRNAAAWKARCA